MNVRERYLGHLDIIVESWDGAIKLLMGSRKKGQKKMDTIAAGYPPT
jgi:hypothetical protein